MQTAARTANSSDEILAHLPRIGGVVPMYVDGDWRLAAQGGTRELYNPGKRCRDRDDRRGDRGRRRGRDRGRPQGI